MTLPKKSLDVDAFFTIGNGIKSIPGLRKAMARALEADREEDLDLSILGTKRPARVRSKAKKKRA